MTNASTEFATETTGKVTAKQLLDTLKFGGGYPHAYMHGKAVYNRPSYSDAFIFEFTVSADAVKGPKSALAVPGYVSNGSDSTRKVHERANPDPFGRAWTTYDGVFRPTSGFWSLMGGVERLRDVLDLLPSDAHVSFHVALDYGTNEYCISADVHTAGGMVEKGLHSDHLFLVAEYTKRGKKVERRFLIDTSVGAHNSARFGVR